MEAGTWRVACILLLCTAGLVRCSPVPRQSLDDQNPSDDPCTEQDKSSEGVRNWNGGIIPYTFGDSLTGDEKAELMVSMYRCENATCTMFVPWTNEPDYVSFESGERCCSFNGRTGGGMQKVSVDNSCLVDHSVDNVLLTLIGTPKQHGTRDLANSSLHQQDDHNGSDGNQVPVASDANCGEMCGGCVQLDPYGNRAGIISSPNYPRHYPHNLECVWKVTAPLGYAIRVTFNDFNVEAEANCNYDSLDVFHIDSRGHTFGYSHFCGSQTPPVISTIGNSSEMVVIHFRSDSSYSAKGFLISYELQARNKDNTCASDHGGCEQVCVADKHGWKTGCACRGGFTLGEDGQSCTDVDECAIRRGRCHQRCTNREGSFQCHCKPGYSLNPDGISCRECSGFHNETSGVLLSPGYPAPYPSHQNCLWTIGIHPRHFLRITLENLDITPSEKCTVDFLKLMHGHFRHKRKLCGYYPRITYLLEQSTYMRFNTDNINNAHNSGFRLSYAQVPEEDVTFLDREYVIVDGSYVPYKKRLWV